MTLEEVAIPRWHIDIVRERLKHFKENPEQVVDFDAALDDIEKSL